MNPILNRRCHAAAARIYGDEPHEQLSAIAAREPYLRSSWSQITDAEARMILRDLEAAARSLDQVLPGRSTRAQRDAIAGIRHRMGWSWRFIRRYVADYGVDDWRQLTQADADHLIQRLNKMAEAMRARSACARAAQ